MEKIKFRPCLPKDVEEAVPLILASGPTSFNYVFTNKSVVVDEFLTFAFQRSGGEFSFDNHYALVLDQKVIGAGAIFSGARAKGFILKDFLNIVRCYKFGAVPILLRGLRIEQILKLPTKNEFCLAHISIAEEERNKGYGQKFIHFLMDQIKNNSSSYFVLDVSEENHNAQRLYERMGFKVDKHIISKYKSKFGYVPNFFRMHFKKEQL